MKKLSVEKMEKIEGGVERPEYCATLGMIMCNNCVIDAMANAWNTHCAPYGYTIPCQQVQVCD